LLVSVTFDAALFTPTTSLPKEMLEVDTATGAMPVPLRLTICGLFFPVSAMLRDAARDPRADGLKVTEIVQFLPAPSVAGLTGQLLVWA
jgi:hypothetical protein